MAQNDPRRRSSRLSSSAASTSGCSTASSRESCARACRWSRPGSRRTSASRRRRSREALIRLQRDGLVEIEPYRGARVVEPSRTTSRRSSSCAPASRPTSPGPRRPAPAGDAARARARGRRSRAALEAGQSQRLVGSLIEFDEALVNGSGNSRMVRVVRAAQRAPRDRGPPSAAPGGRPAPWPSTRRSWPPSGRRRRGRPRAPTAAHIGSVERDVLDASERRSSERATERRVDGRALPAVIAEARRSERNGANGSSCRSAPRAIASIRASQQNGAYWWL